MKKGIMICCFLYSLVVVTSLMAQISVADSAAKYMAIAEAYADQYNHSGAATSYIAVVRFDTTHYEAAWKAGDHLTEFADRLPEKEKSQKEAYFQQSRTWCERAIEINPRSADAHANLGRVFAEEGALGRAIGHYREALRHQPDHPDAMRHLEAALREETSKGPNPSAPAP